MENQKFNYQEILKRIHTTPSVLFLGQNYLAEALSASSSYELPINEKETQCLLDYREILSLRWNTVVSSSTDGNIPSKCGDSFAFEPRIGFDKLQKIDKTIKTGYFLFGQSNNGKTLQDLDLKTRYLSKDIFSKVIRKVIEAYGVIIITGWDFENDWFTSEFLYDVLKDAPGNSVILFGVNREKALRNEFLDELTKKQLSPNDIIEESFYCFLQNNGFFEAEYEDDFFSYDGNSDQLSLYSDDYKKGRIPFILKIPKDTIYELSSKSITLLTDTIGVSTVTKTDENLLRFCSCKGDWSFYAPQNNYVINRQTVYNGTNEDAYERISKSIKMVAEKNKNRSDLIFVTGIHYSGKTTLLKNFAIRYKNQHPIFYIDNYTEGETANTLKNFCEYSVYLPDEILREIIVVCDFKLNSDFEKQKACLTIKNTLSEISGLIPIVIGSAYANYDFGTTQIIKIQLAETLSDEELGRLKSVYKIVDKLTKNTNGSSIFEVISRYYKYQYSPEAADLRKELNSSHSENLDVARSNVNVAYGQIYDQDFDKFIKKGILSSYSNALDKENDERYTEIKNNLKTLNECIALASEFGIVLPNNFVFRTMGWSNYTFLDALNADCFLRQIDNGFCYISSYEAGKYILFNNSVPDDTTLVKENKLKAKEVDILYNIIEICNWYDFNESSIVISLIRKFSPNSVGKDRNIIGYTDTNNNGRGWRYYENYYEQIGKKINEYGKGNAIAICVASAFLRRAYQIDNNNDELIKTAYLNCRETLEDSAFLDFYVNEKNELYIELCNVIIAMNHNKTNGNFDKWDEFLLNFQSLINNCDETDKLEASTILSLWFRAVRIKATINNTKLFEQTLYYASVFLPEIYVADDFNEAIQNYESICNIYNTTFNENTYKADNLKGWLLYQQKDCYQLEPSNCTLGVNEMSIASKIITILNENDETKKAVFEQPLLLKTKILCDWIIKFRTLPYAEENPVLFSDRNFWDELIRNINLYLMLCNDNNPPAAFIKYIKCVYSLVFDDGTYRFDENVRYSKKLQPWYIKRIGVANNSGEFSTFIIGTIAQKNREGFRGKIADSNSILKNLDYIHLSPDVQRYLTEGRTHLTTFTSIPEKPVNIFFNAAGATAAIPREKVVKAHE